MPRTFIWQEIFLNSINKICYASTMKKTPWIHKEKTVYLWFYFVIIYHYTWLITGCLVCIKIVHVYRACNTQIVYHFITSLGVKLYIYHNHKILQLFSTFFLRIEDFYIRKTTQLFLCTLLGLCCKLVPPLLTCAHFAAFFNGFL